MMSYYIDMMSTVYVLFMMVFAWAKVFFMKESVRELPATKGDAWLIAFMIILTNVLLR